MLKQALIEAPILQSPNWDLPFEIMCDDLNCAVGAVLGQRLDKKPTTICYASKTLVEAQINYMTTEKELLEVVHALEKFRPYILESKIIIYTGHVALKYSLFKKRPNHDVYNGCCSFKNSTWRSKTRRAARTRWQTIYRVFKFREEETSVTHSR